MEILSIQYQKQPLAIYPSIARSIHLPSLFPFNDFVHIQQSALQMGNQGVNQASQQSQKIVLRLRSRDIILHYGFKMKASVSDLDVFPHELEGLRLWDIDIIAARYAILESEKFKNQEVLVFKAGVGIAAVALGKWTDAKSITLCDVRDEVVRNGVKNCINNGVTNVISFKLDLQQLQIPTTQYDSIICPDLLSIGLPPQQIAAIFRLLLKEGGEAVLIMPERKEQAKKMLEIVDRKEFKITNLILTAEQYETSPLFNRLDSEKQFPLIGKTNFYAIAFEKLPKQNIQSHAAQQKEEEMVSDLKKSRDKQTVEQQRKELAPQQRKVEEEHNTDQL